jgi:hypothetical protein
VPRRHSIVQSTALQSGPVPRGTHAAAWQHAAGTQSVSVVHAPAAGLGASGDVAGGAGSFVGVGIGAGVGGASVASFGFAPDSCDA